LHPVVFAVIKIIRQFGPGILRDFTELQSDGRGREGQKKQYDIKKPFFHFRYTPMQLLRKYVKKIFMMSQLRY
jgi:hypothetical protein